MVMFIPLNNCVLAFYFILLCVCELNMNSIDEIYVLLVFLSLLGCGKPCLVIPWIVLLELDHLKQTVKPGKPSTVSTDVVDCLNKLVLSSLYVHSTKV